MLRGRHGACAMIRAPPMSKRSRRRPQRPSGGAPKPAPPRTPRAILAVAVLLGLAAFLALVAVDTRASAAFDAPKRLISLVGIAAAGALAALFGLVPLRLPSTRRGRWALGAVAAALALALLSAALAPRPAVAFDTLRTIVLFAAAAVLAAAPPLSRAVWRAVAAGFVAGAAANAGASLLQGAGALDLFAVVQEGGRGAASAWIGNTGVLGLVAALGAVLVVPAVLRRRSPARRVGAAALVLVLAAAAVAVQSVTGVLALGAGVVVALLALVPRRRRRWLAAGAAALALAGAAAAWILVVRPGGRSLDALLSYRFGPWAAAAEMAVDRPALGWGAGSFEAEFPPHLVDAELRWHRRLANPVLAGSYAEAHNEVLQAAAELGMPAALLLLAAAGLVVAPLVRPHGAEAGSGDRRLLGERAAVLGTLAAGAVAALAWFPLQRPATALLLLVALGRAWRLAADAEAAGGDAEIAAPPRPPLGARVALAAAFVALAWPEPARHLAERKLAQVETAVQFVAQRLPPGRQRHVALGRIAREAAALATHPGDERPENTAGTAAMLRGDARRAAEHFAAGLAAGERPELVANWSLARRAAGDAAAAERGMLRAAWISPRMTAELEEQTGVRLRPRLVELGERLAAGELSRDELPPPPAELLAQPPDSPPAGPPPPAR
jgi:O-antigen ligase